MQGGFLGGVFSEDVSLETMGGGGGQDLHNFYSVEPSVMSGLLEGGLPTRFHLDSDLLSIGFEL